MEECFYEVFENLTKALCTVHIAYCLPRTRRAATYKGFREEIILLTLSLFPLFLPSPSRYPTPKYKEVLCYSTVNLSEPNTVQSYFHLTVVLVYVYNINSELHFAQYSIVCITCTV